MLNKIFEGRLSKEEIDRMVNDAERYKAEDLEECERIGLRNSLESYALNIKQTVKDEKLKDKISNEDKSVLSSKTEEVLNWLDHNTQASKDEYQEKQKELEQVAMPIMNKLHQNRGSMPNETSSGDSFPRGNGPTVEEVD